MAQHLHPVKGGTRDHRPSRSWSRTYAIVAVIGGSALTLCSGCVSAHAPAPTRSNLSTGALEATSAGPATTGYSGPVFPLTITRTGGVADYHDTLTLTSDGSVHVAITAADTRDCTLNEAQHHVLSLLAISATRQPEAGELSAQGNPKHAGGQLQSVTDSGPENAPLTLTVTDHRGRVLDLDDTASGTTQDDLGQLVTDVTLSHPVATVCREVRPQ